MLAPAGLATNTRGVPEALPDRRPYHLLGRWLLEIAVCGKLTLDDLVATLEIGDWKMPDFKAGRAYAASQGWLTVEDDTLTRTTAGLTAVASISGR